MKEIERLRLENLVLQNIIDCISESIEKLENSNDTGKYSTFAGSIMSHIENRERGIKFALGQGYTIDYRNSAFFRNRPDGEPVKLYPENRKQL